MKTKNVLIMTILAILPLVAFAQKAEDYQNSYNYMRALEIVEADGDDNEAMEYLRKEIDEHPKNGYAYYVLGLICSKNNMLGEAMEHSLKAIELLKKDKEWITFAYRNQAEIQLMLQHEDEALECWKKALKADAKDVDTYNDRAEYYYQRDMYEESDADFKRICDLQPGNTLGYMGLGRNALEQEQYESAVMMFSYSISLDPSFAKAYAFRAETYMKQEKTNEAINDIIKALELGKDGKALFLAIKMKGAGKNTLHARLKVQQIKQPNEGYWPYCLGVMNEEDSLYMKAIAYYQDANKIMPDDVLYYRIATCYEEFGDFDEALKNIEEASEMAPKDGTYIRKKADLLYDMGRGKEAIATYDQYIKAYPEDYFGYYRRGFLKDNLEDVEGAIEDYSMAIALESDNAYSYLGRGDMLLLKGDTVGAREDYRRVVVLDTVPDDNSCAQYAYMELGEKDRAKEFQRKILEASPIAGNFYDAACLYARMGERDSSLYFLRNSLEKGFTRFAHIRNDDDLDTLRDTQEFRNMMEEYENKYQERQRAKSSTTEDKQEYVSEVPFTREGGTCSVKCRINDLPLYFCFDTGASDVSLSMVEASFMMKNGYLTKEDVMGNAYYSDAQGNVSEGTVVNLRHVQFGDMEIENVRASVVRNQKAPLLLGQTVLSRAGKIEIDNEKRVIRVKYMK